VILAIVRVARRILLAFFRGAVLGLAALIP